MYFKETISPCQLNKLMGGNVYHGIWNPQMDRCWNSKQFQVTSRLIKTEIGKVEHITIHKLKSLSFNGAADVTDSVKFDILKSLFKGMDAIEIIPREDRLVDVMDVYHLWILHDEPLDLVHGKYSISEDVPITWKERWEKKQREVGSNMFSVILYSNGKKYWLNSEIEEEIPFGIHPNDVQGEWIPRPLPRKGSVQFNKLIMNSR